MIGKNKLTVCSEEMCRAIETYLVYLGITGMEVINVEQREDEFEIEFEPSEAKNTPKKK